MNIKLFYDLVSVKEQQYENCDTIYVKKRILKMVYYKMKKFIMYQEEYRVIHNFKYFYKFLYLNFNDNHFHQVENFHIIYFLLYFDCILYLSGINIALLMQDYLNKNIQCP